MCQPAPTASVLSVLAAFLLCAPPAQAQRSESALRADLAFARSLSADWGFVDLAEEVVAGIENQSLSEEMSEDLALAKGEVFAVGAGMVRAAELRDAYYEKAIGAFDDFIYNHPYSDQKARAETALVAASTSLGRSLAMRIEEATGDEAQAMREKLKDVLENAVGLTGDLIAGLKAEPDRTESQNRQLFQLLFNRGSMLLEIARNQEDGSFSFNQSLDSFENLAHTAGEGTPWGLRGLIGLGKCYQAQLQWGDAAEYFKFVVDFAIPRDPELWEQMVEEADLGPEQKGQLFIFVQFGIEGLVDCLRQSGDLEEAVAWGLHYYNIWKREGFNLTPPIGDLGLLALARTLVEAGGWVGGGLTSGDVQWFATKKEVTAAFPSRRDQRSAIDLALSLAETVNRGNRGNVLQVRAQKLISTIIDRPGVEVAPSILFEAALGEYNDRNWAGAVDSFKRVLASLEPLDEAARIEFGPKVLNYLGRSLSRMDRMIEAAVVFEEAVDNWLGDPEYDSRNADDFYKSMEALRRRARGDELIDAMWRKSEDVVQKVGKGGEGDIEYRKAKREFDAKDYAEALRLFKEVPQKGNEYEKALIYVGVCRFKLKELDAAEKVFDDYLNRYVSDPVNATTDPVRIAKRKEAIASATFYWGLAAFDKARAGQGDWQVVIDQLAGFDERFPEQEQFAPAALYRVLIAKANGGDLPGAREVHTRLVERFPESLWTSKASIDVHELVAEQREKAIAAGDEAKSAELLHDLALLMEVSNGISAASFNNLRTESRYWMDLGEWAKAEGVLRRIQTRYGEDPEQAESMVKYVLPDLGTALLRQKKVAETADVLAPLVAPEDARPTRNTARTYALALAGWAETLPDGRIGQVPGLGGEENFASANEILMKLAGSTEKWESPWYEVKFDLAYMWKQWGALDSRKAESSRKQVKELRDQIDPQFSLIKDEELRGRFVWIWSELE